MATVETEQLRPPVFLNTEDTVCRATAETYYSFQRDGRKASEAKRVVKTNLYRGFDWEKVLEKLAERGSYQDTLAYAHVLRDFHEITHLQAISALKAASLHFYDRQLEKYHAGVIEEDDLRLATQLMRGYELWEEQVAAKTTRS